MAKQLLIYESAVPVSAARHADLCVAPVAGYGFSAETNAVPLMAVEFPRAAAEYAIVFTAAGEDVLPAAVLGLRPGQNLYLAPDGRWQGRYIPAFIRRYPFVFSTSDDGKTLTLCIDEAHAGVNREGQGQRLFGEDRKPTAYVQQVLGFLQEYQAQFERTRAFGRRLKELGLLEPMQAQVTLPQGGMFSLTGFLAVSRQKLRALDGEQLAALAKTDELELLYLHLHSMQHFIDVKDRLVGQQAAAAPSAAAETPSADGQTPAVH